MNFTELFEKHENAETLGEKIEQRVVNELNGGSEEQKQRIDDYNSTISKINEYKRKISKIKGNIKNKPKVNAQRRELRKKYQNEIEKLKVRINELKREMI